MADRLSRSRSPKSNSANGQGRPEQVALRQVDPGRVQQAELLLGFDAFGDRQHVEADAERAHRGDDGRAFGALGPDAG